jgi:hypothetical protein
MSRRSGIRFADKDMRQHENLRRVPAILVQISPGSARGCARNEISAAWLKIMTLRLPIPEA